MIYNNMYNHWPVILVILVPKKNVIYGHTTYYVGLFLFMLNFLSNFEHLNEVLDEAATNGLFSF